MGSFVFLAQMRRRFSARSEMSGFFTMRSSQPLQVTQNGDTPWSGAWLFNLSGNPATSGSAYSSSFGQMTSAKNGNRNIQLSLKYFF